MTHQTAPMRLNRSALAAAALFAAIPVCANAQSSVTLYGIADAAVTAVRTGAPGSGTVTGVSTGVLSGSRWGIRGTENIGGGTSALFVLEAGLDLDTGAGKNFAGNPSTATPSAPNGTAGPGFNRRTVVGLEGGWGQLLLGRDYTPFFYTGLEGDALRYGLFGNLQAVVGPAGGSERWARVSNGVFYTSPDLMGLKGRVAYSFGSESGGGAGALPKGANKFLGLGLDYRNGPLTLSTSYQTLAVPDVSGTGTAATFTGGTTNRKDGTIAGNYKLGIVTLTGGYWRMGAPNSVRNTWVGTSVALGDGTLYAQVQQLRQDNPTGAQRRGTVLALGYVHALSKRTALYGTFGQINNNATASFALLSSDTSVAAGAVGADPRGLGFGMRHSF